MLRGALLRMTDPISSAEPRVFAPRNAWRFVTENLAAVVLLSVILVIPCFWHQRIQAGDLGSHMYNAWLAELVERHEISGVDVVWQWTNVLFDLLVANAAKILGFVAAERIVASASVALFFWSTFALIASFSGRPPWGLTPFLLILAYGYAFHMGFLNYYLSLGLAFLALAAVWQKGTGNWLIGVAIGLLAIVAHPIGFAFCYGAALYAWLSEKLCGFWRVSLSVLGLLILLCVRWFFKLQSEFDADWTNKRQAFDILGTDQMKVFGHNYTLLAGVALVWVVVICLGALYNWAIRGEKPLARLVLAVDLYLLSIVAIKALPENVRFGTSGAWAGLLGSRLTLISAVFGLLLLACLKLPPWHVRGTIVIATIFLALLYHDTGGLDRMEENARALVTELPPGTRIVAVAKAPTDWRVPFVYHSIERACIGRCFSYGNYEPSSSQFRVRTAPGTSLVVNSDFKAQAIARGDYTVQPGDLPLVSIFQCDAADWTRLCATELRIGSKTGKPN